MKWDVHCFEVLESTQDSLKNEIIKNAVDDGYVVQARRQLDGRGRHGRKWISRAGNLFLSFVLNPIVEPMFYGQISIRTGVALARAIVQFSDEKIQLKWPNDVLLGGKKCAGILIEAVDDGRLVVGVGVNVACAPEGFACLGERVGVDTVRDVFLAQFSDISDLRFDSVRVAWTKFAPPAGSAVQVKIGDGVRHGTFEGIDEAGALLLSGERITAGDVFFL